MTNNKEIKNKTQEIVENVLAEVRKYNDDLLSENDNQGKTEIKPTTFYLKVCRKTGLPYIGKTRDKNIYKHVSGGSGYREHIAKYGDHFDVIELGVYEYLEDIVAICTKISIDFDIVESDIWLNREVEDGKDGFAAGHSKDFPESHRKRMSESSKGKPKSFSQKAAMKKAQNNQLSGFIVKFPDGREEYMESIWAFSQDNFENGQSANCALRQIAQGKQDYYKGYRVRLATPEEKVRHRKSYEQDNRIYKIKSSEGKEYVTWNLAKFCKERYKSWAKAYYNLNRIALGIQESLYKGKWSAEIINNLEIFNEFNNQRQSNIENEIKAIKKEQKKQAEIQNTILSHIEVIAKGLNITISAVDIIKDRVDVKHLPEQGNGVECEH